MKRVVIPKYEQLILDIGGMSAEQLTALINIAKVALRQKQPRVRKPKAVQQEKSS